MVAGIAAGLTRPKRNHLRWSDGILSRLTKENAMSDKTRLERRYVRAYPRRRFGRWESVDFHSRKGEREQSRFLSNPNQLDFGF